MYHSSSSYCLISLLNVKSDSLDEQNDSNMSPEDLAPLKDYEPDEAQLESLAAELYQLRAQENAINIGAASSSDTDSAGNERKPVKSRKFTQR